MRGRVRGPERRREAMRAGLAAVLAAGAVLLAVGGPARGGDARTGGAAAQPDATAAGRALFARMGCGGCHELAQGAGAGSVGPNLDTVLPNYDAAMLRAKIVDPYPAGASASYAQMPPDYGARMSAGELADLVAFLLAAARD